MFVRSVARFWLAGAALALWAGQAEEPVLAARVLAPQASFAPGKTVDIILELRIAPGFHINSSEPSEENLIPTTADFKPTPGVSFGQAFFPLAEMKTFSFWDRPLAVFEGLIQVSIPVTLAKDFKRPDLVIEGRVRYQACDDTSCRAPEEIFFKSVLKTSPGMPVADAGASGRQDKLPEGTRAGGAEVKKQEDLARTVEERGLLLTFLLVFLGGLALNLTPCVYPLIPITVSYFGGQAGGKKGNLLVHALLYILGMAVTYSVLGSVAAFTGSLFGAALQHPAVLIALAVVLTALALSMFGLYEFRLPAFLSRMAGTSRKGFFGTFFMGLTVGLVAAPCIGPFVLGLLTYVGDRGNVLLGFWLFFLLAMGLGLPFLVLAVFSGSVSRLPRSGSWMVWVRKIFGFILLAMALYFLKTLSPDPLLYNLAMALVLFSAGIYLAWIEPTKSGGQAFPLIRNLVGLAFFVSALLFAQAGIRDSIDRRVTELASRTGGALSLKTVDWQPYSEAHIQEAVSTGMPVFIDFFADWCIPCQELDRKTFSDPDVARLSRRFLMLKADMTSSSDPQTRKLRKQYSIPGVPTLVFLGKDGREKASLRAVGFITKEDFLKRMNQALAEVSQ